MSAPPKAGYCAAHPGQAASHQCDSCGRDLCGDCIRPGTHLLFCAHCGEQAVPIAGAVATTKAAKTGSDATVPLAQRRPERHRSETTHVGLDDLGLLATEHLVVPAAILAMVSAFLFYLLELREAFFGVNTALRQIGFCFVAATVLIARYGKTQRDRERQEFYTGCLAIATLLAMLVRSGSLGSVFFNLLTIALVWRFATRLTRGLSLDLWEAPPTLEEALYGEDRLKMERMAEEHGLKRRKTRGKKKTDGKDAHGNPSGPVAKLALLALVTFALGEPVLAAAPPILGQRAMAAVVVFLFATALVLAAGSAIGTFRHVRREGGLTSTYLVPGRILTGGVLAALALALAMALPGVRFLGQGSLRTASESESNFSAHGESSAGSESDNFPQGEKKARQSEANQGDRKMSQEGEQGQGEEGQEGSPEGDSSSSSSQTMPSGPAGSLLTMLTNLGRFLIPIVIVIAIAVGLFFAIRHFALLRSLAGRAGALFLGFWARLFARLRPRSRPGESPVQDPFLGMDSLAGIAPRQAILDAYDRLLRAFEQAGHRRFERQTPEEFLASIPGRLRDLQPPTASLTQLYLQAAYSAREPEDDAGKHALGHLRQLAEAIRRQRETEQSAPS